MALGSSLWRYHIHDKKKISTLSYQYTIEVQAVAKLKADLSMSRKLKLAPHRISLSRWLASASLKGQI